MSLGTTGKKNRALKRRELQNGIPIKGTWVHKRCNAVNV